MDKIIIKKFNINDLKAVQELNYKLFDFECINFNLEYNMNWTFSEKGESYFEGLIEKGTLWIAVDKDNVIGYLAGVIHGKPSYATKTLAEIDNFYIDNQYRRKGIGKKLVQEFKDYCISQGIEEIKVTALSKNINARNFYENCGFEAFEVTYKMKL